MYKIYIDGSPKKGYDMKSPMIYETLEDAKAVYAVLKVCGKDVYVVDCITEKVLFNTPSSRVWFYTVSVNGRVEKFNKKKQMYDFVLACNEFLPVKNVIVSIAGMKKEIAGDEAMNDFCSDFGDSRYPANTYIKEL